jgi:hypothetical protein
MGQSFCDRELTALSPCDRELIGISDHRHSLTWFGGRATYRAVAAFAEAFDLPSCPFSARKWRCIRVGCWSTTLETMCESV